MQVWGKMCVRVWGYGSVGVWMCKRVNVSQRDWLCRLRWVRERGKARRLEEERIGKLVVRWVWSRRGRR